MLINISDACRPGDNSLEGVHVLLTSQFAPPAADVEILRGLARRKHILASQEKMDNYRKIWTQANDLKMSKPPIFINEICWNEFRSIDLLKCRCTDPVAKLFEGELRKEIFIAENNLGNYIVEDYIEVPIIIYDTDFDIGEKVDIRKTDETNGIVSRHFKPFIKTMDDVSRIKMPEIHIEQELTDKLEALFHEIYDGIIPLRKVGGRGYWFTPWDYLIRTTGVEDAMIGMYDDPDFIEAIVKRYVDCSMEKMRRYSELGLWASNNTSVRVGSGGYGYISKLEPEKHSNDTNCDLKQMWGCGNAQIFSDVSPAMHWQFSLQYELEWISKFGVSYYGCCEPLYRKMDIMRKIPNLRKISMSPWNDLKVASEEIGKDYVMSCKPSPAIFASETFSEDETRAVIAKVLKDTEGSNIELIMKDISTVNYEPQRLIRWAAIAQEEIDRVYG